MEVLERNKELIAVALSWMFQGVAVVPALPHSKVCHLRWRYFEDNPPSESQIRYWFAKGDNNLDLVCGTGGLMVLDFDDPDKYWRWAKRADILACSLTETTGRGIHVFFFVDDPITKTFEECEALGIGHLCLTYPSTHPNGNQYQVISSGLKVLKAKTSELLSLLSELPFRPINNQKQDYPVQPGGIPTGSDVISKIKAAWPILDYARTITQLVATGGDGRWWIGICQLHEDHNPSMWVDSLKGLWGCYSPSCVGHKGGDVIDLYAAVNNIPIREAIRALARELPR